MKKTSLFLLVIIIVVLSFGLRRLAFNVRQNQVRKSYEVTKTALVENSLIEGKKDFKEIKPYTSDSYEIKVDNDPNISPFCDEIYNNVPDTTIDLIEVLKIMRNTNSVEFSRMVNTDKPAYSFGVYVHDYGSDVFLLSSLLDLKYYVNGKCRFR